MALTMTVQGYRDYALATLLAFDCFLRISEFTSLLKEDIALTGPARERGGVVLRLGHTKTGPNQSVVVEDATVATLLTKHVQSLSPNSRVFSFTPAGYRRVFKRMGLDQAYVPHYGGATRAFLLGRSIDWIMHRGRWRSVKTARHYIQSGRA